MALQKRKHSQARRDKRRTHWKLSVAALTKCPQCSGALRPHCVCPHCGFYRGRHVIQIAKGEPAAS